MNSVNCYRFLTIKQNFIIFKLIKKLLPSNFSSFKRFSASFSSIFNKLHAALWKAMTWPVPSICCKSIFDYQKYKGIKFWKKLWFRKNYVFLLDNFFLFFSLCKLLTFKYKEKLLSMFL